MSAGTSHPQVHPVRPAARLAAALALLALGCARNGAAPAPVTSAERARQIHGRVITIDTHDDISGNFGSDEVNPCQLLNRQVDLVKMKEGGLDVAFFVVYVGQGPRTPEGYAAARAEAVRKFEGIHRVAEVLCPDQAEIAYTAADVARIVASGKRAIAIGVENGYPIGTDLEVLRDFYRRGGRYLTLTHNGHNDIGDSSNPLPGEGPGEHGGLSPFGKQVVAELNRLGMMIDVSHVAKSTMLDAARLSKAPVIASHSGAYALNPNARNLDDEQLLAMKQNGGVVQAVALGEFVKADPAEKTAALQAAMQELGISRASRSITPEQRAAYVAKRAELDRRWPAPNVRDYVDHIDHMVKLIGIDHVGISSDFDGGGGVDGFRNASEAPNITVELVRRGYTEEQIRKLWGGNLLRVWQETERVAAELQRAGASR
ncbi:MAG: membrane dipeptidase [Gemmatimonadetes bacterium]|nr:membrane dipeptidase [Gemmatimonadota bacterium]